MLDRYVFENHYFLLEDVMNYLLSRTNPAQQIIDLKLALCGAVNILEKCSFEDSDIYHVNMTEKILSVLVTFLKMTGEDLE